MWWGAAAARVSGAALTFWLAVAVVPSLVALAAGAVLFTSVVSGAAIVAAGLERAALVGHSLGALAALDCAARHPERVERVALLGPAVPMTVSDALLAAAKADEPAAYDLINGWSTSPGKQLGGNRVPGMWLMGNALALMRAVGLDVVSPTSL